MVLAGATVTLTDGGGQVIETAADEAGVFAFCDVPEGEAVVSVELGAFSSDPEKIDVVSGSTVDLRVSVDLNARTPGATVSPLTEAAQAHIYGRVLSREGRRPVVGATMTLVEGGGSALTDSDGAFVLDAPPGDVEVAIRVEHVAYGSQTTAGLKLVGGESLSVELLLDPAPISVDPISVRVTGHRLRRLERDGFYERREWGERLGLGIFLGPEELKERPASRLSAFLDGLASVKRLRYCGGTHCLILLTAAGAPPRSIDIIQFGGKEQFLKPFSRVECPMDLYVDGIPVRLFRWSARGSKAILQVLASVDDFVNVGGLAAIEVYRRASELPAGFGGATDGCGAIAVWTR